MATLIEALDALAAKPWAKEWKNPACKGFLLTGDAKYLAALPQSSDSIWVAHDLLKALAEPARIDEMGKRLLQGCLKTGLPDALGTWLRKWLTGEARQEEQFAIACSVATQLGYSTSVLAIQVTENVEPLCAQNGSPTAAGRFLLSLDDHTLDELIASVAQWRPAHHRASDRPHPFGGGRPDEARLWVPVD